MNEHPESQFLNAKRGNGCQSMTSNQTLAIKLQDRGDGGTGIVGAEV